MPDSGALHLAEIFLSGLLEQLPAEDDSKLSSPRYEFVAGVRELLRSEMPISVTEEVMEEVADDFFNCLPEEIRERVSQDIERRWGTSLRSFEAWLLPDLPWGEVAAAEILPFAQVTREALAQLGEEQAELIQALEQTPSAPLIQEVSNIAFPPLAGV